MNPVFLIIDIVGLVGFLLIGVPVALCFAWAVIFLYLVGGIPGGSSFLISAGFSKLTSIVLVALPLFIIAGVIMSQGGIARRLMDLAEHKVGRFRGGLGIVVVLTTAVFGAMSGMASAAVAAIGEIMIPRMVERGYDRGYAATLVANSAVLALLIPPSASMILYGWISNTSITASFLAPILPGLILILLFLFWNRILVRNMPIETAISTDTEPPKSESSKPEAGNTKKQQITTALLTRRAAPALVMPLIILGAIYGGIATPTEAAAVAVIYAIPVSVLIYRELSLADFYHTLVRAGQIAGALLILVFFATMYSRILTMENVPQMVMHFFLTVSDNRIVLLLMMNVFLLLVGMLMDDSSGILLATPLLMPLVHHLNIDPVQFAAIVGTNLGMGLITPPTAPILYFGALIGETELSSMIKPTMVFLLFAYLPVVLLTTFVPALSLTLPHLLLGN